MSARVYSDVYKVNRMVSKNGKLIDFFRKIRRHCNRVVGETVMNRYTHDLKEIGK